MHAFKRAFKLNQEEKEWEVKERSNLILKVFPILASSSFKWLYKRVK